MSSLLDPTLVVALLLIGTVTGFLAGLLGIGGGMIMVPFVTIILTHRGYPPEYGLTASPLGPSVTIAVVDGFHTWTVTPVNVTGVDPDGDAPAPTAAGNRSSPCRRRRRASAGGASARAARAGARGTRRSSRRRAGRGPSPVPARTRGAAAPTCSRRTSRGRAARRSGRSRGSRRRGRPRTPRPRGGRRRSPRGSRSAARPISWSDNRCTRSVIRSGWIRA